MFESARGARSLFDVHYLHDPHWNPFLSNALLSKHLADFVLHFSELGAAGASLAAFPFLSLPFILQETKWCTSSLQETRPRPLKAFELPRGAIKTCSPYL